MRTRMKVRLRLRSSRPASNLFELLLEAHHHHVMLFFPNPGGKDVLYRRELSSVYNYCQVDYMAVLNSLLNELCGS